MKTRYVITLFLLAGMFPMACTAQQLPQTNGETFSEFAVRILKNDSLLPPNVKNLMKDSKGLFRVEPAENATARFVVEQVVRNDTSTRSVRIKTNHANRIYEEGDLLILEIISNVDGYIYIVNLKPGGTFSVLFPNRYADQQKVKAGETVFFPPKGADTKYQLVTRAPFGEEKIIAIVSKQKLDVEQLESPDFYVTRGLLQGGEKFVVEPTIPISADDFPCQTITVISHPKGQRPVTSSKQRFVLLVGADLYQWEKLLPLQACYNDVKLTAGILAKYGQIDGFIALTGADLTKKNLRLAFDALIANSNPGDEIFIVWTGHGGSRADTSGTQPTGLTTYLLLYDSIPTDPKSVFTDMEFEHWLDDLDGRRIAIFLDACFAEGMIDANTKSETAEDFNFFANKFARHQALDGSKDIRPDQAAVLCSSRKDEKSVVRKDVPISAMIWCMANCVFENDKAVSFDDICQYVEKRVPVVVANQYKKKQQPVYINQIGTIFVKP